MKEKINLNENESQKDKTIVKEKINEIVNKNEINNENDNIKKEENNNFDFKLNKKEFNNHNNDDFN